VKNADWFLCLLRGKESFTNWLSGFNVYLAGEHFLFAVCWQGHRTKCLDFKPKNLYFLVKNKKKNPDLTCLSNVSTECWNWRRMLRQMRETTLSQSIHVHITSDKQNIVHLLAKMTLCIMMLCNFPHFFGPHVISYGPTKQLSIRQFVKVVTWNMLIFSLALE